MLLLNNNLNICFLALYSELYLLFTIIFIITFLVIFDNIYKQKFILIRLCNILFIYVLIFTFIINTTLLKSNFCIFYNSLIINEFIIIIKNISVILLGIISYISVKYLKFENIFIYEFFILLNLILIGLFLIIGANDLLVMYMGIEVISLSFYILTTSKIHNNFSTEAGMKYFILGAFSSGLLLFGSSLIYGSLGTINFSDISIIFYNDYCFFDFNPLIIGSIFIVVGLLFKLGAVPFHMWLPDVYEGAPTIITLLFSIVPKIVIFGLILHFYIHLSYLNIFFFQEMLYYSSILSIILGSLGALYQTKIKRLLAYSAISHVGFLLLGFLPFNVSGLFSLFFYLIVYIIISINIFLVLLLFRKYNTKLKLKKINEYVLIFKSYPIIAINFSLILFSIAGIPPLVGFYSKLYIFIVAFKSNFYLIVIIASLFSVLSSLYYIRLIKLMFFKTFEYWTIFYPIKFVESFFCSFVFFFNILFFCYPEFFIIYIFNLILRTM